MSVPQSKFIEISALPRLVVERISRTPGTERTACFHRAGDLDHHLLGGPVAGLQRH